ncbi:MAG: AfsR/SARP family transcriptional regulator [Actinoplanes sp.]
MIDGRAAAPLRFEILGDLRVLRNASPVDLGPAKQRAVLAVLLLQAGRPVPTHQIVDAVWGDEPPENGANVVQKYVAGLRRVLDPDRTPRTPGELLALTGSGYVLRVSGSSLDVDEFQAAITKAADERAAGRLTEATETLRAGLALWRGEALAGLSGPAFEAARTRLADLHATAWEKWAENELARGQDTALIPDLARLVEDFPLREGLRAQLMIALHQGGRQAEALAAFRDAREYFLDQFGAEPGEKMQDAHRRILRGETFYAAPVDPWASEENTSVTPTPMPAPFYEPPPVTHTPLPPPPPPVTWMAPPRPRVPWVEVICAVLLPVCTLSLGGFIYFVYAALRHHKRWLFLAAAGYLGLFILGGIFMEIDPTPSDSPDTSTAEGIGTLIFVVNGIVAAAHGAVVATQSTNTTRDWILREQARQFAAMDPAQAVYLGIGRPDLNRSYDDGGLIDVNNVATAELARAFRLDMPAAHRIVAERQRGPYHRPEELQERGLVSARTMRRLHPRLIALPPAAAPTPSPWTPS